MVNKNGVMCLIVSILLVNVVHCGLMHQLLDKIALHELGSHAHRAAYSLADGASSAYGSFKNYFANIYLRPVLEPSAVSSQQLGVASSSASCASSTSSARSADAVGISDVRVLPAPVNLLPEGDLVEPTVIVSPPAEQPAIESPSVATAAAAAAAAAAASAPVNLLPEGVLAEPTVIASPPVEQPAIESPAAAAAAAAAAASAASENAEAK